jgi:hypothetical protein
MPARLVINFKLECRHVLYTSVVSHLFMRRLMLYMMLFFMVACGTNGTIGQIDDILHDGNYTIEWEFQGCFGSGAEKLKVTDRKTATYTFLDYSLKDGPMSNTKTISWTVEKEMKLIKIFEIGVRLQDSLALCTTTTKYVLTSWPNSIEFDDLNCEVTEKFEELIK